MVVVPKLMDLYFFQRTRYGPTIMGLVHCGRLYFSFLGTQVEGLCWVLTRIQIHHLNSPVVEDHYHLDIICSRLMPPRNPDMEIMDWRCL